MKRISWVRNLSLVFASCFLGVLTAEGFLRICGRYNGIAGIEIGGTNKIWERTPLSEIISRHPDTNDRLIRSFNSFGAKVANKKDNKIGEFNVGVFGDSFTENSRLENSFSFVHFLNDHSKKIQFHNFGVDGYGMEQSYQNWIDKQKILNMDVVLYFFYKNDLRNTYEAKIFDPKKMTYGEVKNIVNKSIPLKIKIISKVHLSYLFIETSQKIRTLINDNGITNSSLENLNKKLANKFSKAKQDHKNRHYTDIALKIREDYLSDNPKELTIQTANHFRNTLLNWEKMVKDKQGEFYVVIIPDPETEELAKKLIPNSIKILKIKRDLPIGSLNNYDWTFSNDNHWNEYANLAAAYSLINELKKEGLASEINIMSGDYVRNKINLIDLYYKQ